MYALIELVQIASTVISILVIARALISWVSPDLRNPIVQTIYRLSEPIMAPVRGLLPSAGGIDFSPLIVLIGVQVLERLIVQALLSMA